MGSTLLGGSEFRGNIPTVTPQQEQFLSSLLGSAQPGAQNALQDFLQPPSADQYPEMFEQSFTNPAIQQLQREIIPAIQERFMGLNESGSGALNRALSQAASDVSTGMGEKMMQQYNQSQQQRMQALGLMPTFGQMKTYEPWLENKQGVAGPLLSAIGAVAGGML